MLPMCRTPLNPSPGAICAEIGTSELYAIWEAAPLIGDYGGLLRLMAFLKTVKRSLGSDLVRPSATYS